MGTAALKCLKSFMKNRLSAFLAWRRDLPGYPACVAQLGRLVQMLMKIRAPRFS